MNDGHALDPAIELTHARSASFRLLPWHVQSRGRRPRDVAGSHTWDNAVGAIARWELGHPHGIGADAGAAHQLRTWLAQTRHWLGTTDRTFESPVVHRSPSELIDRRAQLEQILDAAQLTAATSLTSFRLANSPSRTPATC